MLLLYFKVQFISIPSVTILFLGSDHFEIERLLDYVGDTESSCKHDLEVTLPVATELNLCLDPVKSNPDKPCQLVILRLVH